MLLEGFTITSILPTPKDPSMIRIIAKLSDDISEIIPYLNAIIPIANYNPETGSLTFKKGDRVITLYPRTCAIGWLSDEEDAVQTMNWIKDIINETYERREIITPCYEPGGVLNPMKVHSLLPGTNCEQCGEMTCLAFAFGLTDGEHHLKECTPLSQPEFTDNQQALTKLLERVAKIDL